MVPLAQGSLDAGMGKSAPVFKVPLSEGTVAKATADVAEAMAPAGATGSTPGVSVACESAQPSLRTELLGLVYRM